MKSLRFAFLGCSRGLGRAVAGNTKKPQGAQLLCGRHQENLQTLARETEGGQVESVDFSKSPEPLLSILDQFQPTHIYYFAGGGPFGLFHEKNFKDHEWTFRVSFQTPAHLIHWSLRNNVQQFVAVGSAVAESSGDPYGGSYAASKQALSGLCQSIWKESPAFDLRLFSPHYMDTDLLPKNSYPRQQGLKLLKPHEVANLFWDWVLAPEAKKHYIIE